MTDSARYYAAYNPDISQPAPVAAWYDSNINISIDYSKAGFLPLSSDQWAARAKAAYAVSGGTLVVYSPPPTVIPLKIQAATALAWVQQQANLAAAMGEVFTADMKAYVSAINALANGTDTTSKALPTQPTDVMMTSAATTAGV
ncbi:MAG: hypothetical protein ABF636_01550 [Acetobacter sp.]